MLVHLETIIDYGLDGSASGWLFFKNLEEGRAPIAGFRRRGLALAQQMRCIGVPRAPSFKQIIMEKGKGPLEGVKIPGSTNLEQEELKV